MASVTLKQIADKLNLSVMTVSYALNGRNRVSEETRQRVFDTAREMGYQPNPMAKALVSGRTHVIEFLTRNVHPAYYSSTIKALKEQISGTEYQVHIVETHDWNEEQWSGGHRSAWPADGVIVLEEHTSLKHLIERGKITTPVVSISNHYVEGIDLVYIDLYSGAIRAVRHLVEGGYRRIAFLAPDSWFEGAPDSRTRGYEDAMREAGAPTEAIRIDFQPGESDRAAARRVVRACINAQDHPEAFFCFNDESAIGARAALRDLGLRVPEDVALVGCDGIEDAEYQDPPISTLIIPYASMTRLAWEFLQRRIEEPDLPLQSATLEPELCVRASSRSRKLWISP